MNDEQTFLAAIEAAPGDHLPRLIYADRLEEFGDDDRAAFLRLFCELADLTAEVQFLDRMPMLPDRVAGLRWKGKPMTRAQLDRLHRANDLLGTQAALAARINNPNWTALVGYRDGMPRIRVTSVVEECDAGRYRILAHATTDIPLSPGYRVLGIFEDRSTMSGLVVRHVHPCNEFGVYQLELIGGDDAAIR